MFPIYVPPPSQRREDVPALVRHFIERFAAEESKPVTGLTAEASDLIERFNWPGNVRQLENTIFRAVVLCDGATLDVCDFPQIAAALGVEQTVRRPVASAEAPLRPAHAPVRAAAPEPSPYALMTVDAAGHMRKLEEMESEIIRTAISRYEGHMSEVARRLGIGRSTLYRKLKDLGLDEPAEAEHDEPRAAAG